MSDPTPPTTPLRLVTIVAEAVLQDHLVRELQELGARGYTVTNVHGEGSRGTRASQIEGGNVRLEVIVSEDVAGRILARLAEAWFPHYAVIAWTQTVEVVRGGKYV